MYLPLVSEKYNVIFFWNPKCGCTSIKTWFLNIHDKQYNDFIESQEIYIENVSKYLTNNKINNILNKLGCYYALKYKTNKDRLKLNSSSYEKILIYRNPYTRLASYYTLHITGCQNSYSQIINSDKCQEFNKNLKFDEFVNILYKFKDTIDDFPDIHLRSQSKNIKEIIFDKKINLKNLNDEINEWCNKKMIKTFLNKSYNSSRVYDKTYASIYNDDIRKKVYEIYKSDFIFLNISYDDYF